jgi:hypothetical protein
MRNGQRMFRMQARVVSTGHASTSRIDLDDAVELLFRAGRKRALP